MNTGANDQNTLLQDALRYAEELSFSIIPIKGSYYAEGGKEEERTKDAKRPLIRWATYQKRRAEGKEIRKWWEKWPYANIGIVTGTISNLAVIDIDTEDGKKAIQELIPDSLVMPTCTTPKGGQHMYFKCADEKLMNNAKIVTGCDLRANGGYIVAPPSVTGNGKGYIWVTGLSPFDVEVPALPEAYITYINKSSIKGGCRGEKEDTADVVDNMFACGRRDEDLFHVANTLTKGGMLPEESLQVLKSIANSWGEGDQEKWFSEKIKSALNRVSVREKSLAEEVREWVLSSNGAFTSSDVVFSLGLSSREEKKNLSKILTRLCSDGTIKKNGDKNGCFRRIDDSCETIDFIHAPTECLDIRWPLEIERYVNIMPKNIVVAAGIPNSGKTAFLLSTVYNNMNQHDIHYFSSEMGGGELRRRLSNFDIPLEKWKFTPKERSSDFADVIRPDAINIIDYLEMHEDFFKVGGYIKDIHDKLNKGIAIIALQKNSDKHFGLGGERGMEKARLYLAMDHGRMTIMKAKNRSNPDVNPNGLEVHFKIIDGSKFSITQDWAHSRALTQMAKVG